MQATGGDRRRPAATGELSLWNTPAVEFIIGAADGDGGGLDRSVASRGAQLSSTAGPR